MLVVYIFRGANIRNEKGIKMFLERVINQINNYMIISNITLYIMSIAIITMSFTYLFHLFFKKQLFERNLIYAGIAARALMFIGFTIEFAHQMATYNKYRPLYNAKWDAAVQLSHFLFWGYIAVIGAYYLFTIGIKKYKGLIYTFDIAMMSIPVVFGIVLGIFGGLYSGGIETLLLVPLPAACLFVFFQCYWRRKPLYYIAFFLTAGISAACAYRFKPLKLMLPFMTFLFLLGIYDLFMADLRINKYRQLFMILPIIFIVAANPFYNLWTVVESGQTYKVSNIFYKDVKNVSLKEIEKRMREALGNNEDKLVLLKVSNDYISKEYELQLGDYDIRVLGVDGKIFEIKRKDYNKPGSAGSSFDEAELMDKSLKFLKQLGFSFNPDTVEAKGKIENGDYIISFYHKYADGRLLDAFRMCELRWDSDSKLKYSIGGGIFDLKDYSTVKISEVNIKDILSDFYKKLDQTEPNYVINNLSEIWRSSVNIVCENGDSFEIDAVSGEIISYNTALDNYKFDTTKEGTIKNREKAINYAKSITTFWDQGDFKETQLGKSYAYGQYNFAGSAPGVNITIETLVSINGKLLSFDQRITPDSNKYSNSAFKINRKEAINLVKENYNALKIYTAKAALVLTTDDYYNTELKWRVGVVPFMSPEKQYYLVDVNTGKVEPVGDYGGGE